MLVLSSNNQLSSCVATLLLSSSYFKASLKQTYERIEQPFGFNREGYIKFYYKFNSVIEDML